jgi:hypothetical protein
LIVATNGRSAISGKAKTAKHTKFIWHTYVKRKVLAYEMSGKQVQIILKGFSVLDGVGLFSPTYGCEERWHIGC